MHPLLAAGVANALFADRVGTARPRPVRRGAATSGPSARKAVATPVADASDVVIRTAGANDAPALARLGALDSNRRAGALLAAAADENAVLVAEVDGRIEAALALDGDTAVADPFSASALHAQLLELRARQLGGDTVRGGHSRLGVLAPHTS